MLLTIGNVWTQVSQASLSEQAWLFSFLSFDAGKPRFFRGRTVPPPVIKLYNMTTHTIPSGMVPLVLRGAREAQPPVSVTVQDTRAPTPTQPMDLGWLGNDTRGAVQREAVERMLAAKRGVLQAPTGVGKTHVAVAIALSAGGEWLIFVPDVSLLRQTADRWEQITGAKAGMFGNGLWEEGEWAQNTRLSVATYQTMHKAPLAKEILERAIGFVADEFHTASANTFSSVLSRCVNATYRFGVSATPNARGDQKSLIGAAMAGPVVHRVKFEELAQAGVLSRPKIQMRTCVQEGEASAQWHATEAKWVVNSDLRNDLLVDVARHSAKPALMFVNSVAHGLAMARKLRAAGIEADFVWGKAEATMRETAVKRLVRGDTEVLVCSKIFQQGVDIPSLAAVIVGGAGAAQISAIQRVGRGMRTDEGQKMTFEVWDIMDRGVSTLERHARARIKAYKSEGYEVSVDGG